MHYKKGREAKNGDKVMVIPGNGRAPFVGILYDGQAGNDYCNGRVAVISPSDPMPNLAECLHLDDVVVSTKPESEQPSAPATAPVEPAPEAAPST